LTRELRTDTYFCVSVASEPVADIPRPFGLAPELTTFFKTRAHARVLETLTFGLRRRERFLLVTGELGTGKTVLCHVLVDSLRAHRPVSFVANPQLTPAGWYGRLLEDFTSSDDAGVADSAAATVSELHERLMSVLASLGRRRGGPLIVVDDAHTIPPILVELLMALAAGEASVEQPLQIVLVGLARPGGCGVLGVRALDEVASTRTRLSTWTRDECERYVKHRLSIAGCNPNLFTPRGIAVLHSLSGGIPRLVNLIAERALQLAQGQGAQQIDSGAVAAVASSLEPVSARPRRFRWFTRRVS
jgi:type II secretory pathway predicted ATPase ExeA